MINKELSETLSKRLIQLQDPWMFMNYCVFTRDEVDAKQPLKPAPVHWPYVETVSLLWQEYDRIIFDKSRRLWISWELLILNLHLSFTTINRRIGIISKKFDDACAHLESMKFVYENIPDEVYPKIYRPKIRQKEGYLFFDEIGSVIHALASGPDQARQYGFSSILWDEMDYCEEQEATYAALKPTLDGGGKLAIATTHAPQTTGEESFYKKLLEDQV